MFFLRLLRNQAIQMTQEDYQEHSRQIAGKKPPLTRLMHIGIEAEKKGEKLNEFFSVFSSVSKVLELGLQF